MGFKSARISAGLSVLEVSEALRVTDVAIYQWETGVNMPNTKRLPEIANLYGCTIDELLTTNDQ